jgi:hypothetical protein
VYCAETSSSRAMSMLLRGLFRCLSFRRLVVGLVAGDHRAGIGRLFLGFIGHPRKVGGDVC